MIFSDVFESEYEYIIIYEFPNSEDSYPKFFDLGTTSFIPIFEIPIPSFSSINKIGISFSLLK